MRAATYARAGGLEVVEIHDVPEPVPTANEVLVDVAYAGLNRADILERQGRYDSPEPTSGPLIPGLEYSGLVAGFGENVTGFNVGDRVFGIVSGRAQAERLVANASAVMRVPSGVALEVAAAIPEAYMTASDALRQGGFAMGAAVLVHAAGSAVALAAADLIKAGGGQPIGTTRSPAKAVRACEHGFAACWLLEADWVANAQALTADRGVSLVLDFVGPSIFERNVAALAMNGRIVQIGLLGGTKATVSFGGLMGKRGTLIGTTLRARPLYEKAALAKAFEAAVVPLFARGALHPVIDRVMELSNLREAHTAMESNDNFGKIILRIR